jgi:lipoprotein signal peptidase
MASPQVRFFFKVIIVIIHSTFLIYKKIKNKLFQTVLFLIIFSGQVSNTVDSH